MNYSIAMSNRMIVTIKKAESKFEDTDEYNQLYVMGMLNNIKSVFEHWGKISVYNVLEHFGIHAEPIFGFFGWDASMDDDVDIKFEITEEDVILKFTCHLIA